METVQSYKCPCCGAALIYKEHTLHCDSCGNNFDVETMRYLEEAEKAAAEGSTYNWESYNPKSYNPNEYDEYNKSDSAKDAAGTELSGYTCPSCGAEIVGDDNMGATVCPYCGSAAVIKSRFDGTLKPDWIIPFKVDKKAAIAAFEADFKNAPFLPDEFKDKNKIAEMSGIYLPFWMFDCDCNAFVTYNAKRISGWSDANYNYTKTDHFKLFRSGSIGFANIPVDGSRKTDNKYTEAIEPFDCNEAVSFSGGYLAGYFADKYDVSAEECTERANERVKNSTVAAFADTAAGYTGVFPDTTKINFSDGKIRYSLLPVWMLNIKYKDIVYKFAVNGQTGKVAGEYPVDKKKKNLYFAKILGIGYIIAAVAAYLLLR